MADPDVALAVAQPDGYFGNTRREIEPLLPSEAQHVLELGCAFGATMAWLRGIRRVEHAVGIEMMPAAAARARAVFEQVLIADLGRDEPDLGMARFDLVLALDVLEHLPDPGRVLRFVRRHMSAGSTIIISVPNVAHHSVAVPLLLRGSWDYADEGLLDRTHLRFFTRRSAVALLEDAGFIIRQVAANRRYPSFLQALGLTGRNGRYYDERLMRALLPARLLEFQYLIAATSEA